MVSGPPGYIIASGMGHCWAPSRHNRKKGCFLLVKVAIYLELFPKDIELSAYIFFYFERLYVICVVVDCGPGYIIASEIVGHLRDIIERRAVCCL